MDFQARRTGAALVHLFLLIWRQAAGPRKNTASRVQVKGKGAAAAIQQNQEVWGATSSKAESAAEAAAVRYLTVSAATTGLSAPPRAPRHSVSTGLVVASLASTAGREHPAAGTVASAAASEVRASLTLEGRSNLAGGAPASETCRPIGRREVAGFPF